jgi:hypothetical protein
MSKLKAARIFPVFATILVACASRQHAPAVPRPPIIPHSQWEAQPAVGHAADATRRNIGANGTLTFRDFRIDVLSTTVDSAGGGARDVARIRLTQGNTTEEKVVAEGSAFNWRGFHVAVVAIYGPKELGAGLVALEIATVASLPPQIASATSAGGADMRLRIPHQITHVTLHHTGDARPLLPGEDPVQRLRGLQSWGARDRNWWDLPYHFLMDLEGRIFEGRDYHYMGETNTTYDPGGHFLISIIGNYGRQEPTRAQIEAIADLMAWAVQEFDVPLDRIGGHYNYATTGCPGQHLKKYLEDGTFRRMVAARLAK